ncbi:MAG: hypothetical protein OQJ95_11185 [Kangiella sp.]|jgi:hypothetical protein|nr:hypothetical protein [Kangiella sp.]MCW9028484.1 hypothetical protein [Kangiella sp.]
MSEPTIALTTISPVQIGVGLKLGVNTASAKYESFIDAVCELEGCTNASSLKSQDQQYSKLNDDVKNLRLFIWEDAENNVKLHVFPNNIAIAEVTLEYSEVLTSEQLEALSQADTRKAIQTVWGGFVSFVNKVRNINNNDILDYDIEQMAKPDVHWISRAILLNQQSLQKNNIQKLIKEWLSNTRDPDDAEKIIAGEKKYSMTWLNYVVVEPSHWQESAALDYRVDSMILSQYFYTAQENCNKQLIDAIEHAYVSKKLLQAENELSTSRVAARMHLISYHEHLKYLTRAKRKLVADILECWEFDTLVQNSKRMVEVCSSRLEEADHKRRERSTVLTDLLLVTLSFFAVFELSLYLVEFSREMMSRPALDYNDESTSFFLSFIANIDTDYMFGFGVGLTVILIVLYRKIKAR